MKAPERAPSLSPADPIDEIEAMILRLIELRKEEQSAERREDYRQAVDRLDALAYRMRAAATPGRVIGLLNKPPAPIAVPPVPVKPLQTAMPLGPVIVRARKPRR